MFPDLAFDSWLTIGIDQNPGLKDLSQQLLLLVILGLMISKLVETLSLIASSEVAGSL